MNTAIITLVAGVIALITAIWLLVEGATGIGIVTLLIAGGLLFYGMLIKSRQRL
jgi:hypothetical protein